MRVYLVKKFAESIDGINLHGCHVGDVLELESFTAGLLIAEGWAVPERRAGQMRHSHLPGALSSSSSVKKSLAADRRKRSASARTRGH